ncbi:hypothetical protein AB1Y20_014758 [Prymnesium parvum]|uniref:Uncharacterized protein n=1 Tax=Prymnesium parvum TaxID=97485 RepID=A0AB34IEE6_PRYPA
MALRYTSLCSLLLLCPLSAVSPHKPLMRLQMQRSSPAVMIDVHIDHHTAGQRKPARLSGWERIARAGSATPVRTAHSVFGLASIVFGTSDIIDVLSHGGISSISGTECFMHILVYTVVAALSLPRAKNRWTNEKPGSLWMPSARDSHVWITFVQFAWYTTVILSDYVRPVDEALFALDQPLFLCFTWFVVVATLYSTSRSILEDGTKTSGLYDTQWKNGLYVIFNVAVIMLIDVGRVLFLAHSPEIKAEWVSFLASYSQWPGLMQSAFLLGSYLTNVGWFMASAEHYKLITNSQVGAFTTTTQLAALGSTIVAAFAIDEGRMALGAYHLTFEAMLSAVHIR